MVKEKQKELVRAMVIFCNTHTRPIYNREEKKTSSTFLVEETLEKESSEISKVKVCGVLNVSASRALRLTPADRGACSPSGATPRA